MKDITVYSFSSNDFIDSCPVTKRLFSLIGFQNSKQIIGLGISIFAPLLILSIVTISEKRFFYGSVKEPITNFEGILGLKYLEGLTKACQAKLASIDVLGMSFLGDTMVWPFAIFVPVTFLALKYSIRISIELLNRMCKKKTDEWHADNQSGFNETVERTKMIFRLEAGWKSKCLKTAPWIIAFVFWGYNTMTCTATGFFIYPYTSDKVVLLNSSPASPCLSKKDIKFPVTVKLPQKIKLQKWDCDIKKAPLSNIMTRIWTLFYYGLPPFILARLIVLIWGVSSFLLSISRWEAEFKQDAIKIEPFGEDGFDGLNFLFDAGMSYYYVTFLFVILLTMSFLKEGPEPSWHNYILLIGFFPIGFLLSLTPSVAIRKSIVRAKEGHLQMIIGEIKALSNEIIQPLTNNNRNLNHNDPIAQNDRLKTLKSLYDHVKSIPEWPFSSSTFFQIALTMGIPIGMIIIDKFISKLF